MKRVMKYPIAADYDEATAGWDPCQVIEIPCGAEILSVAMQGTKPMLWALVNPDAPVERRKLYITDDGSRLPDEFGIRRFIGTIVFGYGKFVLHVFE